MTAHVEYVCEQHPDPYECADNLVVYVANFREYGLIIHDGGTSSSGIDYCPWCGVRLPESQRDRWFEELRRRGIDPWTDEVPPEFDDETWLASS